MIKFIQGFIAKEFTAGLFLLCAAIAALIVVNSPLENWYINLLHMPLSFHFGTFTLNKSVLHWINDGLMTIFFLLVGIEIKRELLEGELNSLRKASLPVVAAIGGMIVPSIIFFLLNHHDKIAVRGWAIPSATDIAFALGLLTLFSSRIPFALKVFLMALAILDDLGAILIITLFYTEQFSWLALVFAGVCVAALVSLNRNNVTNFTPYAIIGMFLWLCILQSGVHATLAGVIIAFAYPLRNVKRPSEALSHEIEAGLLPWVNYAVLPLFAFANAGIPLDNLNRSIVLGSIPLGIIAGLFFGKQIGIFGACWIAIRYKIAKLPSGIKWRHIYAMSIICGIGFTMSLFIGGLAYQGKGLFYAESVRFGVLMASLLSAIVGGLFILIFCKPSKKAARIAE